MSLDDFSLIFRAIPHYSGRIGLGLSGESLLLGNLSEYCALTRKYWPNCTIQLITTLNIDRGPEYLQTLFSSGLDLLQISCYGYTATEYATLHGVDLFEPLCANIRHLATIKDLDQKEVQLLVFADSSSGRNAQEKADQVKFLRFAATHGVRSAVVRQQHSWQGRVQTELPWQHGAPFPCSAVWGSRADHLNVSWELNVLPCCYFRGDEYVFGNLGQSSLSDVFNSEAYTAFYQAVWEHRLDDLPLCKACTLIHQQSGSPLELSRLAAYDGQRLAGKHVYFWGGGEAYRSYGEYFRQVLPQAMLLDCGDIPHDVDGIPVAHPDDVLNQWPKLPLIIFAQPVNSGLILKRIMEQYPRYSLGDIILAPAAMSFDQQKVLSLNGLASCIDEGSYV
jgi:hypothetical protein